MMVWPSPPEPVRVESSEVQEREEEPEEEERLRGRPDARTDADVAREKIGLLHGVDG